MGQVVPIPFEGNMVCRREDRLRRLPKRLPDLGDPDQFLVGQITQIQHALVGWEPPKPINDAISPAFSAKPCPW